MPEGPEVETIRRSLEARLLEQRIESIWRSDFALRTPSSETDYSYLVGTQIKVLSRTGKILIVDTDLGRGLLFQFGMSGGLFFSPVDAQLLKHTHLRITFEGTRSELRFVDPRRFGDIKRFHSLEEREQLLSKVGPDAMMFTKKHMSSASRVIQRSHRPIKAVLLDQSVLSGVGNIYACEALHLSKISPTALSSKLTLPELERLLMACKSVMLAAVENSGTTFRSYLDANGEKGQNQNHLRVFAREGQSCFTCGDTIVRIVQSGRSSFYCPKCQD